MAQRKATKTTYWFEPLGGTMNQRVKATQIPFREAKFLYNMSHDRVGVWRTRPGRDLIATTLSGTGGIKGLMAYKKPLFDEVLFVVGGRNLYFWDGTDTLTQLGSSNLFANAVKVRGVNYLSRLYLFSESVNDKLRYTDGNTVTTVGGTSAAKQVTAKFGAVAQSTLWISGVGNQPERVYASRFDESTVTPTDEFWEASQDFASSTRFFIMPGEVKGVVSFKDFAYAFTGDTLTRLNILDIGTLRGASKVLDIGTTSQESIAVDTKFGIMMWADGRSGIYIWTGAGDAVNVAELIVDRAEGRGVMDLISSVKFDDLAAIIHDGKYWLALGDLTDAGLEYFDNACLVYDIAGNKWGLRNVEASVFTEFKNQSGEKGIYAGSADSLSVYELEQGILDDDSSGDAGVYTAFVRTKDLNGEFGPQGNIKTFSDLVVAYKGTSKIQVSYSINGDSTYAKVPQGFINPSVSNKDRVDAFIPLPKDCKGKSISFEFRRPATFTEQDGKTVSDNSGEMEIIGFGLDVVTRRNTGLKANNNF